MDTGRITFGPRLKGADAAAVKRHVQDATARASRGHSGPLDPKDQRIMGLLEERGLLLGEVGLLQRTLATFADHDCECHECPACAARETWQGSLRRWPRR